MTHIQGRNISIVLFAAICVACADAPKRTTSNQPYCNVSLSRNKGMVNKHFSARIQWNSNFVKNPEYIVSGTLPPGLSLDSNTGIIDGTPTVAGFWQIQVRVRDRERGTHGQPAGEKWSYYDNVELGIYDKLIDDK